ncbi:unnamed protein product [Closterium sp. NIES-65]|nr:unnamed protein product [Closterium sp. NIES-65]
MEDALTHLRELFPKVDVRLLKAAIREHGTSPEAMDEVVQYLMDEALSDSSSSDGEISDKEDDVENINTDSAGFAPLGVTDRHESSSPIDAKSFDETADNEDPSGEAVNEESFFEAEENLPASRASLQDSAASSDDRIILGLSEIPVMTVLPASSNLYSENSVGEEGEKHDEQDLSALVATGQGPDNISTIGTIDTTSTIDTTGTIGATGERSADSLEAPLTASSDSEDFGELMAGSAPPLDATLEESVDGADLVYENLKEDAINGDKADGGQVEGDSIEGADADVREAGVVIKAGAKLFADAADAAGASGSTDGTEEEEEKAEVEKAVVVNEPEGEPESEPESEPQQADGENKGGAGVGREEIQGEPEQATHKAEPVMEKGEERDEAVAVQEESKGEEVRMQEVFKEGEEATEGKQEKRADEREKEVKDEGQKEREEEEEECEHVEVPESLVNSWSRSFVEVEVSTIAHHVASTRDAKSRLDAQLASVQTLLSEVERAEQQAAAAETALSHAGEADVAEAENVLRHVVRSQQALEIRAAQVFGHRAQLQEDSQGLKARVEAIQGQFADVERQVEELRVVLEGRLERARERIGELEKRRREREEAGRRKLEGAERDMGQVLGEVPGLERQERACAELADALVARHHEADVLEGQLAVLREDLAALVRGVGRLPGLPGEAAEDMGYSFLSEEGKEGGEVQEQESYHSLHEVLTQASAAAATAASAPDAILPAVQAAPVTDLTAEDPSNLVAGLLGLTNASSPASVGDLNAAAAATSIAGALPGAGAAGAAALYSELCSAQNIGASSATTTAAAAAAAAAEVNAPPGDSSFSNATAAAAIESTFALPTPSAFEDEEQFEAKMREMSSMLKETVPVARSRFHQQQQQQPQQQVGVGSGLAESNIGVEGVTMIEDGDWSVLETSDLLTESGLGGASGLCAAGNGAGYGVGGVLGGADDEARWSGHSSFSVHAGSTPRAREGGVVRGESGEISEVMERYFGSSE